FDQINNTVGVTSVNGSSGIITKSEIFSGSVLSDIEDVDTTGIAIGKILKWDGSKWIVSDDLSAGGTGSVTTTEISDDTIVDADISASAGIAQSKISGLTALAVAVGSNTTALSSKVSIATTVNGKALSSNVTLVTTDVAEGTNLYYTSARAKADAILNSTAGSETDQAASVAAMKSFVNTADNLKVDKSTTVNGQALSSNVVLDTDDVAEGTTSFYHTTARARTAAVVNSTAGSETDQAASVAAMKSYVTAQTSGAGTGDFKSDGSVSMSADFDLGNNKLKLKSDNTNYVELKSPNSLTATYSLIFPANDGVASQVLTTDGSGNLSWVNAASGSVTSVTAGAPLASSGGATPNISITQATTTTSGYLSSTDWNAFNSKVSGTTTVNGKALSSNVTLVTTDVAEGTNLYYTSARAKADAILNSTAGSETDQAASVAAMKSFVNTADNLKVDKSTTVNGQALSSNVVLDTDDVAEGTTSFYHTTARARTAAVVDSTAGSETDQAASVAAMKSYVTAQTGSITSSQWTTLVSNIYYTTGNVGIGTSTPSEKLEVNGNIKATQLCIGADCKSTWPSGGGAPTTCPSGFIMVGTAGKPNSFCIEASRRATVSYSVAAATCDGLIDGDWGRAQLCSVRQWQQACNDHNDGSALVGLNTFADASGTEWMAGSTSYQSSNGEIYATVSANYTTTVAGCYAYSYIATLISPGSRSYRCCY
ncbi:hypothetical protein, partial [Bacteriovorax sp. Seq25_V]|uniref:hypothetical protein n=1 Tax=Bacteriovorax sp. Seq25_V TaxID=1201288 RepID=UPI00038A3226